MLERNKKPVYYCKRYIENDLEMFKPPTLIYLNYKSVSGEASLTTGGEVNTKNLIAKAVNGDFSENDRCYMNVSPPKEYDPFCSKADYRVVSVLKSHRVTEIILERLAG